MTTPTTPLENSLIYPKTLTENLRFRVWLQRQCKIDERMRLAVRAKCKQDILFFFNTILWTPDPRTELKNLPFITYAFQDSYLLWLVDHYRRKEDCLTEKSRDMGVSMMMLGFIFWLWMFEDGFNSLLGSYIEDMVDNGTLDSHFGRLDYFIDHTPKWLLPESYSRSSMNLENTTGRSAIVGYAPTERFSRGGRYSLVFADELAFWKHARTAWTAMGDATPCRMTASTPNGKGNKFADLALKSNIAKMTLHWKLHPNKDEAWYEAEKRRRTEEEIAQELDINYNKSVTGRVYPEFDDYNFLSHQEYNPLEPLFCSWDFGLNDPTAILWLQTNPKTGKVRVIDAYQKEGKSIDFFVPFITGQIKSFREYAYDEEELRMIQKHSEWQAATHFGDPTGNSEHQTSKISVIAQLREHGIIVNSTYKEFGIGDRVQKTKLLIRRLEVEKDLEDFIDAIQNAHYPQRTELSQATTAVVKPVHDWTSHFRTALEFYAVNENLKKAAKGAIVRKMTSAFDSARDRIDQYVHDQEKKKANGGSSPKYRRCV